MILLVISTEIVQMLYFSAFGNCLHNQMPWSVMGSCSLAGKSCLHMLQVKYKEKRIRAAGITNKGPLFAVPAALRKQKQHYIITNSGEGM
jgi:hypothetical protein